jgi:peptide deformylase
MVLPLTYYGNPVLRQKGEPVDTITPELVQLIEDMFDTMREYRGIGLAAQQIGRAIQLTVIDIRAVEDRPSTLELDGEEVDPHSIMPLVLLNPEIEHLGPEETGPEGCLSFPEIYGDISRPGRIRLKALNEKGEPTDFICGGLLSRCIQHETDHLHGILFIDRMDRETKAEAKDDLNELLEQTKADLIDPEA